MKKSLCPFLFFFILCSILKIQEVAAQTGEIVVPQLGQSRPGISSYKLTISNNYKETDEKLKPKSFKITVKNNSIEAIDQSAPKGLTRTPSKFPPASGSVVWTNNTGDIPNGKINLGDIHFGKAEKFSVSCQWINATGDVIYQTEKLWTDYNIHDPGFADTNVDSGVADDKGKTYQVKWTPVVPPPPVNDLKQNKPRDPTHDVPPNKTLVKNPEPFNNPKAQSEPHPIVIIGHPRPNIMVYLGAGSNSPSTKVNDDAYVTNNVGFDANVFVPIIKKKNFSFGFNGGGEYFSSNKDNLPAAPNVFHVPGETSGTVAITSSGSPKNSGFKVGVAPQVNFFIGKHFIISPMIEAGYISMTTKGFSAVQTTDVNGTQYNFTLLGKTETKTSGFAVTPKVRLNYMFTKKIGVWVETNYTVGPTLQSSITTLLPEPDPDENGQYNIDQMTNGTTKTEVRETKFGSFGVHVGVVFGIALDRMGIPNKSE